MKYEKLIQFQPIEEIIQLRQSSKKDIAKNLVSTYVISDQMQEKLSELVIPQLRFDQPADNKGLLVIGNYGTGKSHLMAVISSITEDKEFLQGIKNEKVKEDAEPIAGRFKVKRLEIGAVTTSLRDIVVSNLENFIQDEGLDFSFHQAHETDSNKRDFELMMEKFHQKYPDKGLLLIVDELLDFLRSKKDQELILDLGFLRELGEVCGYLKFRFIAGVQEAIFDSPSFQFVANSLKRVKDRFQQILIVRDDIKYVVAHRLLQKSDEQKSLIREHLEKFQIFFPPIQQRMEEFVNLFPVHPDYIEVFDNITVAEKREILKALSFTMKKILNQDLPGDRPGLISYDSYWPILTSDPSFRTIPDIRQVVECSNVLLSKIEHAFTRPQYKDVAVRLVHGLSVNRLTMNDIYAPIGASAEELRDTLCIYHPVIEDMGGEPDRDLLSMVETVLAEIHKTVNGQFISKNKENGQYYLDLEKTEDYDAKIEQRAESLSESVFDRYFFAFLRRAMECADDTYVTGYQIWEHEVEWRSHKVTRFGYLFFGSPNERSTAVPPRDFYLYFLQPYDPPSFKDEQKEDELLFYLAGRDKEFDNHIRMYTASAELASVNSGNAKKTYQSKAEGFMQEASSWLHTNMMRAFEIVYRGTRKPLIEWIKGKQPSSELDSLRDAVNSAASVILEEYFSSLAPKYPQFSILLTHENRHQAVREAIRGIIGTTMNKQSRAVLDGLGLLEGETLSPHDSPYAREIIGILGTGDDGDKVINRSELISDVHGIEYFNPETFRLEPELLVVVLVALVYTGDIILSIPGKSLDASNVQDLAGLGIEELTAFKHVKRPKEWNVSGIRSLFELLELPPGKAKGITQGDAQAVSDVQSRLRERVDELLLIQRNLDEGFRFWTSPLFEDDERSEYKRQLADAKEFLDSLQQFDTPGKFKNFRHSQKEVQSHSDGMELLKELKQIRSLLQDSEELVSYLTTAHAVLLEESDLHEKMGHVKRDVMGLLKDEKARVKQQTRDDIKRRLEEVKEEYKREYMRLHKRVRLNASGDKKKKNLLHDVRLKELDVLSSVDLLPHQSLTRFREELASIKTCYNLTERDLDTNPVCPHCGFKPLQEDCSIEVEHLLGQMDGRIDKLHDSWVQTLLSNLKDPTVQQNFELLKDDQKRIIEEFLSSKSLPDEVNGTFVETVQELLSGLYKIPVDMEELKKTLFTDGSPLQPEELEERFQHFVKTKMGTKEQRKVRFVLE